MSNEIPRPARILIVEDELDTLETMAALLTLHGHVVECCFGAKGCLLSVKNFRPEVVLLDLGMPDITGYDLAFMIREMEHFKNVLLIAVSGYGAELDKVRSKKAGI